MECPVCGSGALKPYAAESREPHGETFWDEGVRCLKCGAVSEERECRHARLPEGAGRVTALPDDRIVYYEDETGMLVTATVLEVVTDDGWLEVRDEPWPGAIEGDTPWISPALVVRNLTKEAESVLKNLTLEEKLVASVAIVNYRKERKVA